MENGIEDFINTLPYTYTTVTKFTSSPNVISTEWNDLVFAMGMEAEHVAMPTLISVYEYHWILIYALVLYRWGDKPEAISGWKMGWRPRGAIIDWSTAKGYYTDFASNAYQKYWLGTAMAQNPPRKLFDIIDITRGYRMLKYRHLATLSDTMVHNLYERNKPLLKGMYGIDDSNMVYSQPGTLLFDRGNVKAIVTPMWYRSTGINDWKEFNPLAYRVSNGVPVYVACPDKMGNHLVNIPNDLRFMFDYNPLIKGNENIMNSLKSVATKLTFVNS